MLTLTQKCSYFCFIQFERVTAKSVIMQLTNMDLLIAKNYTFFVSICFGWIEALKDQQLVGLRCFD